MSKMKKQDKKKEPMKDQVKPGQNQGKKPEEDKKTNPQSF